MKKYNKDFIAGLLKSSLLVLFILLPKIPIALTNLKQNSTPSTLESEEKMYETGAYTYRIDFHKASNLTAPTRNKPYVEGQGIIIKEEGNFSPSFSFRIREYCKDSIVTFSTQTLISRLSNKNMDVIFVMTLEEKNSDKSKWYGCYVLNENFKKNTWTVLNGKHKIEEYIITENTYLKGYIWNKGAGDIAVDHLELILGIETNAINKKPPLDVLNPEIKSYPIDIKNSIFKTNISGELVGDLKRKTYNKQANYYNKQLIFCNESQFSVTDIKGNPVGKPINFNKKIVAPCLNYSKNGLLITSKILKNNLLRLVSISKDFKNIRDTTIKATVSKEVILSEGHADSEINGILGVSIDAKSAFLIKSNFTITKINIKLNPVETISVKNLKQIDKNKFIVITSNNDKTDIYIGSLLNGEIKFSLLTYIYEREKNLLALDETSSWINSENGNYFILSNKIRKTLFKISLNNDKSISILKNYHLKRFGEYFSPNYYEYTYMFKGKMNDDVGLYFNCYNSTETQKNHPEIKNNIIYFYKID